MKILSRDFTFREKIVLLVLSIILLGLFYFYAVDIPVRDGIAEAKANMESMQSEMMLLQNKVSELKSMREQLSEMEESSDVSRMESYNNSKNEVAFLNDIMADTVDYTFSFDEVTRSGNQIRRPIILEYSASSYQNAMSILKRLEACPDRILIGEVRCDTSGTDSSVNSGAVNVSLTATFYETMVGGTEDLALPQDEKVEEANEEQ